MDYSKFLNSKIRSVSPSGIRRFFDIANEMDDVISLSIGEPDFQTPWHIRDEGIRSLEKGKTWYSPNRGFVALLDEITKYYDRRFSLNYSPSAEARLSTLRSGLWSSPATRSLFPSPRLSATSR